MSQGSPSGAGLSARDAEQLAERGISLDEAERQLSLLRNPPPARQLERPCVQGDGIRVLDAEEQDRLAERFERTVGDRLTRMVPASGAASRMFAEPVAFAREGAAHSREELQAEAAAGHGQAAAILELFDQREALPFRDELLAACGTEHWHDPRAVAEALVSPPPSGLGYAERPKGLVPFHRYPGGARTAFEEHLREAADQTPSRDFRAHFTVGADHEPAFRELLGGLAEALEGGPGHRFEVGFSHQSPATDTLALNAEGAPFRNADGTLLLRPGGHGALLANLDALATAGADLVQIKNIDNVVPDRDRGRVTLWQRVLGGLLLDLQTSGHDLLRRLDAGESNAVADAQRFVADSLGLELPEDRLVEQLDRPWRVCGMVVNEGEPGGGPFWVPGPLGDARPQIVEAAEIDLDDPAQRAIRDAATHFNPVDIVCGLRNARGEPYELARFSDPRAVFIAEKSHQGRPLRALERPGLWNGAMARWNTVFVEVPAATFAPVKTVLDLLRPAHRAAD